MRLGHVERAPREKAQQKPAWTPPPTVKADGIEYEVVWNGDKNGPSLLPERDQSADGHCRQFGRTHWTNVEDDKDPQEWFEDLFFAQDEDA